MRYLTILFLLLCGCSASATVAPIDAAKVRASVDDSLALLDLAIEREDEVLASTVVADTFVMGNNVFIRYREAAWEGQGVAKFRQFFETVFNQHANIFHEITVDEFEIVGDLATATVTVSFNSVKSNVTPPENYTAEGHDYMVFQRDSGSWKLHRWDEVPPQPEPEPEPGEGGEGGEGGESV